MSDRKWGLMFLLLVVTLLAGLGGVTIIIDPYFHYHAPLKSFQYPIDDERYQNDGIVKNFDYNAIITGTSTTENFKTSEFDEMFGLHSVKVPYSGATYREINDNLKRAIKANPDIKCILRGLDSGRLIDDKDNLKYDDLPDYLYDNYFYNDVYYILNKEILLKSTYNVLKFTDAGNSTTSFDEYCNWMEGAVFGKEAIETSLERNINAAEKIPFSEKEYEILYGNVTQNIIDLAKANPEIVFYLYFTPYSIYYWDAVKQSGTLEMQLEAQKVTTELLLECENIHLYSFFDKYEIVCEPDNYADMLHFKEEINSQILEWIYLGENLLTKDNYEEYYKKIHEFYTEYDYERLWN